MRKLILYGIIIFQVLLILSLVRGIQLSRRSAVRIADLQSTKSKLAAEQEELRRQGEYVQSPFYLEQVAREELHLSKSGESVVIVPDSQRVGESASQKTQEQEGEANWQKWWKVLSGQ